LHQEPIAVETQGPLNESARDLLSDVDRQISMSSGDDREVHFLFQHVAVVVQRFNSMTVFVLKTSRTDGHSSLLFVVNFCNTWNFVLGLNNNKPNNNNNNNNNNHTDGKKKIIIIRFVERCGYIFNFIRRKRQQESKKNNNNNNNNNNNRQTDRQATMTVKRAQSATVADTSKSKHG